MPFSYTMLSPGAILLLIGILALAQAAAYLSGRHSH